MFYIKNETLSQLYTNTPSPLPSIPGKHHCTPGLRELAPLRTSCEWNHTVFVPCDEIFFLSCLLPAVKYIPDSDHPSPPPSQAWQVPGDGGMQRRGGWVECGSQSPTPMLAEPPASCRDLWAEQRAAGDALEEAVLREAALPGGRGAGPGAPQGCAGGPAPRCAQQ